MVEPGEQRIEILERRDGYIVRLTGEIDESFDSTRLETLRGVVVLDLDGVGRITSYGVRKWLRAIQAMQASYYCFVRCRPGIVSQFNMMFGRFGGSGQMISLYVPYLCVSCGAEVETLVDLRTQHGQLMAIASKHVSCPRCAGRAEFDDLPGSYFSYVSSVPPPNVPAAVDAILDGSTPAAGRLRVDKDVEGTLTTLWLSGSIDRGAHLKRAAEGLEGDVILVLDQVGHVDDQGLRRLRALTTAPGARVAIARLPLHLVPPIANGLDALGDVGVASVLLTQSCASCGTERTTELDEELLAQLLVGTATKTACATCGSGLSPPTTDQLKAAGGLPWATPNTEVRRYLRERSAARPAPPATRGSGAPPASTPLPPSSTSGPAAGLSRLASGSRLGRYEILDRIASGGMGSVYLGRLIGIGGFERIVALKTMHPHLAADPQFVAMFLDEARLAARIHHPNVVATLDVEDGPDGVFIVMEHVKGISARSLMRRTGGPNRSLPVAISVRILLDALAGLHAAHELRDPSGEPLNLVHRDVTPHNLLIGADGVTRLTDFGIARAERRLSSHTVTGLVKGKYAYMAPEQFSEGTVDRRTDLYAAAVVGWELLAGRRLFAGENDQATIGQAINGTSELPTTYNRAVPAAVGDVILTALSRTPGARPPSAAALADDLEQACQRAGIPPATARVVGDYVAVVAPQS